MKALSLTQPWASLVAIGAKEIETRSWSTKHRGWLAIHAAKAMPGWAREICFDEPFFSAFESVGDWVPDADLPTTTKLNLPFGAIVAVVNLHHVGEIRRNPPDGQPYIYPKPWVVRGPELDFGDFTPGRFGWILTGGYRLKEPIPCKGALGLWTVPVEIEAEIRKQTGLRKEG